MNFNGLSTEQAPPISVPLRFFLTAPVFGIIAGLLILFSDADSLLSRFSIESIAVTHAFTIGFFSFIMLGALTQMLPVLAGVKIFKVLKVATLSHILLFFGTIFMLLGLLTENSFFNMLAFIGLGFGFLVILSSIALAVTKVENFTPTIKAMGTSLFFAFFVLFIGLFLLYSYMSNDVWAFQHIVANIHSVWGIFGFVGILIIGVSFQVLPMFYVAPRFKPFCKKKVVWIISIGLILWLLSNIFFDSLTIFVKILIALFFLAYSIASWNKLNERRRKVSDITIWYWRTASISLLFGLFLWVFDEFFVKEYIVLTAVIIGGGFILSILMGMLYKIIPFLVWFHLNGMGYMSIPTMNEMINKNLSKSQFILFIVSYLGFVFSFFIPSFMELFAITLIGSMALLQYNIMMPVMLYIKTKKSKPDFDMNAFVSSAIN